MYHIRFLTCGAFLCVFFPKIAVGQQDDASISQRLDALQVSLENLSEKVDANKGWSAKELVTSIGSMTGVLAVIVSAATIWVNRKMSLRSLTQKANEEKARNLQERLDKFYGPLIQFRNQSRLLYKAFKGRQPDPANFRTLTALLSGKNFDNNDKVLLDEIIKIGKDTETLIKQSSGLVDEDLQEILGKATTHYLVLRLAYEKLLQGDVDQFQEYVFPNELDHAIKQKIESIKQELIALRAVS